MFCFLLALPLVVWGWWVFSLLVRRLIRSGDRWPWSHLVFVVLLFSVCFAGYRAMVNWRRWGNVVGAALEFAWWPVLPTLAVNAWVRRQEGHARRRRLNAQRTHEAYTAIQAWRGRQDPSGDADAGTAPPADPNDDSGAS